MTLTVERQMYSMWQRFGLRFFAKQRRAKDLPMPGRAVKSPIPLVSFK